MGINKKSVIPARAGIQNRLKFMGSLRTIGIIIRIYIDIIYIIVYKYGKLFLMDV